MAEDSLLDDSFDKTANKTSIEYFTEAGFWLVNHKSVQASIWNSLMMLSNLGSFEKLAGDFKNHLEGFKTIFDSAEPHR